MPVLLERRDSIVPFYLRTSRMYVTCMFTEACREAQIRHGSGGTLRPAGVM